jgi:hypothetical protein
MDGLMKGWWLVGQREKRVGVVCFKGKCVSLYNAPHSNRTMIIIIITHNTMNNDNDEQQQLASRLLGGSSSISILQTPESSSEVLKDF